jgi:uncharacterized RDD family membrane protein YckC
VEPRPAWLPADASWPPATHTASPPPAPAGTPPPTPIDWTARREAAFGPIQYSGTHYAGFWVRFVAVFIDSLIVGIPLALIGFALYGSQVNAALANQNGGTPSTFNTAPFQGLELVVQAVYFAFFWSTGSTPGMRIFGIRVADAANPEASIGFGRAILRWVGYLVSSACCAIGLIWAAFDSRKQGWHDKIAGTVVVYNR